MNDQQLPPRQQPRRRVPPQRPPASRESRFIGYVVLGFGALAIIAMLMLAFSGDTPLSEQQQNLQNELVAAQSAAPIAEQPAQKTKQLYIKRQKKIDVDDLQGGWQAMIGDYLTVLQIQKNAFQIIMALPDPAMPREYFSGTYEIIDDIIRLSPKFEWGAPKTPPNSGITYNRLTSSPFPMIVGFDGGKMVWQNISPGTEKRFYVPARAPLLANDNKDYIIWKKTD